MNRILCFLRRNPFLLATIALVFLTLATTGYADSSAKLEKHARKIEKRLAKYRTGTLLQVDFRDNSETLGSLGSLSDASFQITNTDSNKVQSFNYTDVDHVRKTKEYIGAGSAPEHRYFRHWVPLLVGAAAVGGGAAAWEATR